ncbi:TetR/AcrR family transcriptional regulator [Actinoplanes couchii]|uniref:TetR family transcriptional regulator n=1 Tax=Actinoplanes couchii TaxID=403638 RepID=A0ABQ3XL33_9ACTN|nr:TetR/AcrR family transcriptional regulator [Actinoplanes couchii]MDR6318421.1 AcrR family transcriptional regulator [Actinoplanes couchii]GID59213.1 TetR family transcriptional regulator [Actinoplanes couchii]
MPRVTEQYRADRRSDILAASARLFAVNGFHATSMADIIEACGLSAGSFYRYFKSKDELITAVAEEALTAADGTFRKLLADNATPSPEQALTAIITMIDERIASHQNSGVDLGRIGVQAWAEALRSPALAVRASEVYQRLRGNHAEVARRWQAAGNAPADLDPDQLGAAMLSLVQGYILQRLLLDGTSAVDYLAGVRGLLAMTSPTKANDRS